MSSTNSSDSDEEEIDHGAGLAVEDDKHVEKREETVTITSLKVHKALLKAKSEAYVPQMVSLGPYHHNSLKEVMDSYKLNSAKDATKDKPTLFDYFLDHVKEMASDFEQFYKIEIDDQTKFARIMMMDGFFLYQVLINEHHDPHQSEVSQRNNETHPIEVSSIKCDIVKLENQIPLFLLFEIDSTLHNKTLGSCLNSHIPHLSCFQLYNDLNIDYVDEPHLLACLHKYVSSFLQTNNPKKEQGEDKPRDCTGFERAVDNKVAAAFGFIFPHPVKQGRGDFVDRYNAKELVKVGIKFKSLAKVSCKLKFDKFSNTLFLPKIVIAETYTEVLMRNLLALEFNDPNRPKHVTQYVELMSCLINTAEDVILLRKRNIIDGHSMRTTDEYVVKMWEGLAKTLLFCEFVEERQVIKAAISETLIKNYYKRKIRNWWDMHVCKPFRF